MSFEAFTQKVSSTAKPSPAPTPRYGMMQELEEHMGNKLLHRPDATAKAESWTSGSKVTAAW